MENFITFLVVLAIFQVKADVDYKLFDYNAEALETAVKAKAHFVLLYANEDLCPECNAVRTTIHGLMAEYNLAEDSKVTVAELDCSENTDFCTKLEVKTYPEFYFFPSGDGKNIKYVGDAKKEDLKTFIDEQAASASKTTTIEPKNGLYELTQDSFKSFVAEGNHFIKFYAPWCGHCKKLAPTWDELAKGFEKSEDVKISKIDCTAHTEVCRDHGIRGYPTLKFFSAGEDIESYKGTRSHDELKKFVTEQVQKRNAPPQEEAAVETEEAEVAKDAVRELTDQDFSDVTSSGVAFVKFYAPWCGHCKRLAPTWEELAKDVSSMTGVSIAKIDCTKYKEVCSENEVRGYPTLYLFKDGERKPKYSGGRDLASLKAYLTGEFKKDEL